MPPHTNFELQLAVADVRKFADLLPLICKQKETLNAAISKYMTQPKPDADAPEPRAKRPELNVRSKFDSRVYAAFERKLEKPLATEAPADQEVADEKAESDKPADRRSLASAAVVGTAAATTVALAVITGCAAVKAQEANGEIKRLQDSGQLLRMMQDKNAAQRKLAAQTMTRVMGVDYSVDAAAVQPPEVAAELLANLAEIDSTTAAKAAEKLVVIAEREISTGNFPSAQLQCSKLHNILGACPQDQRSFFNAKFNLLQARILKGYGNLRRAKYAALRAVDNLSGCSDQQFRCEVYFEAGELMRILTCDDLGASHLAHALSCTDASPETRAKVLTSLAYLASSRQANLDAQTNLNEALALLKDETQGMQRAVIYEAMAEVALRSGSAEGSYARYKQALVERRIAGGNACAEAIGTMHRMAQMLIDQKRFDEASAIIEESLDLLPESTTQRELLAAGLDLKAHSLEASGKLQEAIPVYKQALEMFQPKIDADAEQPLKVLKSIAAIQEKINQPNSAIRSYRQIISHLQTHDALDDFYVEAVDHLADLYRDQRLWRKSEQAYESALFELNLCPQTEDQKATLLQEYGKHYASVGRFADAVEQYQQALHTIRTTAKADFSEEKLGALYEDFNRAVRHLPVSQQRDRQLSQLLSSS